jgi:hypothetical protein
MQRLSCILIFVVLSAWETVLAASVPQEPEKDNREYVLDIVTNDYSRWWREIWDAGDNRLRFRLGSNSVTEWFLEEELKFSTSLHDRVRFRFYHSRQFRYATEQISWDVLEFEGRIHDQLYLSLYARPTFDKREGSLGVMFQSRDAVDRFFKLSIEWPGFMRNFSEHHRETSDSLLNVFTDHPIRFGLDMHEEITPNVWIRATGEFVPEFTMGEEINATGELISLESAEAKGVDGWLEYVVDPSRGVRDQMAFGVEAGAQRSTKSKDFQDRPAPVYGTPDALLFPRADGSVSSRTDTRMSLRGDETLWAVPQNHFGEDLYERTDDDTVTRWRDTRGYVSPYAWVPLGERVTLRGTFRYEKREIGIEGDTDRTSFTTNEYLVPRIGVSYAMGNERQCLVEAGFVSESRKRTEEYADAFEPRVTVSEQRFSDHRLYLAFEYVFGESNVIRLNEGFELDPEDRGQFGIHDHGFFQLIVGF